MAESLAAPLAAAKHPLGASLALFEGFEAGWDGKPLTRGQGQRIRHATIHANRRGDIGRGVVLNRQRKGDMPAVRGEADRGIVQLASLANLGMYHPYQFSHRKIFIDQELFTTKFNFYCLLGYNRTYSYN